MTAGKREPRGLGRAVQWVLFARASERLAGMDEGVAQSSACSGRPADRDWGVVVDAHQAQHSVGLGLGESLAELFGDDQLHRVHFVLRTVLLTRVRDLTNTRSFDHASSRFLWVGGWFGLGT